MNKKLNLILTVLIISITAQISSAAPEKHIMEPYIGSAQFEQLKALAGRWEGTHQMGEEISDAVVLYQATSNGSAVVETLFPGTSHEMVSVYHDEAGKVKMTHYCAFGNQPRMTLKNSTDNELVFEFTPQDNTINALTEGHMHGVTISFNDDGTIKHQWIMYQDGKETGNTIIDLTRADNN